MSTAQKLMISTIFFVGLTGCCGARINATIKEYSDKITVLEGRIKTNQTEYDRKAQIELDTQRVLQGQSKSLTDNNTSMESEKRKLAEDLERAKTRLSENVRFLAYMCGRWANATKDNEYCARHRIKFDQLKLLDDTDPQRPIAPKPRLPNRPYNGFKPA